MKIHRQKSPAKITGGINFGIGKLAKQQKLTAQQETEFRWNGKITPDIIRRCKTKCLAGNDEWKQKSANNYSIK